MLSHSSEILSGLRVGLSRMRKGCNNSMEPRPRVRLIKRLTPLQPKSYIMAGEWRLKGVTSKLVA